MSSPCARADFAPRSPWITGDLQTVRNFLLRPRVDLTPWPAQRLWLPLPPGPEPAGDEMAASLQAPERIGEAPLVVVLHGLTGCERSVYVRHSARFWLQRGHPLVRLNLRGSPPSRPRCRGHYHAGRSADVHAALQLLVERQPRIATQGLVLVGYSLGGNVLIKLLAESGRELPIRAAATVSAPIDLKATALRFHRPRNRLYLRWLLTLMKREALRPPALVSAQERQAIRGARTVLEFDDRFVAPRFGFDGAEGYYRDCFGLQFLPDVEVPLLALNARDDPWIPVAPYEQAAGFGNPHLRVRVTDGGGHVGFHAADHPHPWHDRAIRAFLREVG